MPGDGRSCDLACTPKGEALGRTAPPNLADHVGELFDAMSQDEQEQVLAFLIEIRRDGKLNSEKRNRKPLT